LSANLQRSEMSGEAAGNLAKRVGMSTRNLYYLLAVYRNRPDLFELVFDGTYTINKAYTPARARCNGENTTSMSHLGIRTHTREVAIVGESQSAFTN